MLKTFLMTQIQQASDISIAEALKTTPETTIFVVTYKLSLPNIAQIINTL